MGKKRAEPHKTNFWDFAIHALDRGHGGRLMILISVIAFLTILCHDMKSFDRAGVLKHLIDKVFGVFGLTAGIVALLMGLTIMWLIQKLRAKDEEIDRLVSFRRILYHLKREMFEFVKRETNAGREPKIEVFMEEHGESLKDLCHRPSGYIGHDKGEENR